jgi:hypothetical protein
VAESIKTSRKSIEPPDIGRSDFILMSVTGLLSNHYVSILDYWYAGQPHAIGLGFIRETRYHLHCVNGRCGMRGNGSIEMARNDLAVKMGADVVKMAKFVALDKSITLAEYLTERLRPMVARDYQDVARKMAGPVEQELPRKRGAKK